MSRARFTEPLLFPRAGKTAHNRVALAAMTNQQSHADGSLSEHEFKWLVRRAEGGFGIVTTCASHVHPRGQGWPGALGIDDDRLLPGLERLAQGLREHGALSLVQIFHGGARSPRELTGNAPISASAGNLPGESKGPGAVSASEADLAEVVRAFAAAAQRAERAGWDGVELHGAHGYLLSQFLSPLANRRTDRWGGSLENRMHLLREVFAAVKEAVSPQFIVGVRLSPRIFPGQNAATTLEAFDVAQTLVADGADFIHISLWDFRTTLTEDDPAPASPEPTPLRLIDLARDSVTAGCPLFVAGKIHTPADAAETLEAGTDVVALGRVAIPYPAWPRQAEAGGFEPKMPPYRATDLSAAAVGPAFLDYLRRWRGFVED